MATCPLCLYANAVDAVLCARCGKFRFPQPPPDMAVADDESSMLRTRIINDIQDEMEVIEESSRRTIRGPLTVSNAAIQKILGPVEPTADVCVEDDSFSTVAVETTPEPLAPSIPRLQLIRGEKSDIEFPIKYGRNFIGRAAEKPVDIDLTSLESSEQVWSSRQHALIIYDRGMLLIEDLHSLNGTFVNRSRLHPGQQRMLQTNDVVQIGHVQFKVIMN